MNSKQTKEFIKALDALVAEKGIDKAIVWRGCGDFPAEFKWCGMDTVNLLRGYFQDIFSMNFRLSLYLFNASICFY